MAKATPSPAVKYTARAAELDKMIENDQKVKAQMMRAISSNMMMHRKSQRRRIRP
jgi:hypothetical protein